MEPETDLKTIKRISEQKKQENLYFRAYLKSCDLRSDELDAIVHRITREVTAKIDCAECNNCCKQLAPVFDDETLTRICTQLSIDAQAFRTQHLVWDDFEDGYTTSDGPCPFLPFKSQLFSDYCPTSCVEYPHLMKDGIRTRLLNVVENYAVCPIVFNVYERLKREVWSDR